MINKYGLNNMSDFFMSGVCDGLGFRVQLQCGTFNSPFGSVSMARIATAPHMANGEPDTADNFEHDGLDEHILQCIQAGVLPLWYPATIVPATGQPGHDGMAEWYHRVLVKDFHLLQVWLTDVHRWNQIHQMSKVDAYVQDTKDAKVRQYMIMNMPIKRFPDDRRHCLGMDVAGQIASVPVNGRITPDTIIELFKARFPGGTDVIEALILNGGFTKATFMPEKGLSLTNLEKALNYFIRMYHPSVIITPMNEVNSVLPHRPQYMFSMGELVESREFPGLGDGSQCFKRHHDFMVVLQAPSGGTQETRIHIPNNYTVLVEQFETLIYLFQAELSKWKVEQLNRKYRPFLLKFVLGDDEKKNIIRAPLEAAITSVANEYNLTWSEVVGEHGIAYMLQYLHDPNIGRITFQRGDHQSNHQFNLDNVDTCYRQLTSFWQDNEDVAKWLADKHPDSRKVMEVTVAYRGAKNNLPAYFMGAAMDFLRPKKAIIMQVGDEVLDVYRYEITKNHFVE